MRRHWCRRKFLNKATWTKIRCIVLENLMQDDEKTFRTNVFKIWKYRENGSNLIESGNVWSDYENEIRKNIFKVNFIAGKIRNIFWSYFRYWKNMLRSFSSQKKYFKVIFVTGKLFWGHLRYRKNRKKILRSFSSQEKLFMSFSLQEKSGKIFWDHLRYSVTRKIIKNFWNQFHQKSSGQKLVRDLKLSRFGIRIAQKINLKFFLQRIWTEKGIC